MDSLCHFYTQKKDKVIFMFIKTLGLCEGRHELPETVEGFVFPQEIPDPTDTLRLSDHASRVIGRCDSVVLYVTGLTVALGAVINHCAYEGIHLTLMHFDRNSGGYYPQYLF